eukprot:Platyproteum_vivax@DN3973_c0_g1_i1.p1
MALRCGDIQEPVEKTEDEASKSEDIADKPEDEIEPLYLSSDYDFSDFDDEDISNNYSSQSFNHEFLKSDESSFENGSLWNNSSPYKRRMYSSYADGESNDLRFVKDTLAFTSVLKKRIRDLPKSVRTRWKRHKEKLVPRARRLWKHVKSARARRFLHKLCFVMVFFDIVITSYWLGAHPASYYICYSTKLLVFLIIRLVTFRLKRWHYYLFDFCYYANVLLVLYIWLFPENSFLYKACFAFTGTLGLSIPLFRNSLVPHSLEKATTTEVHFSPVVVVWTLRWFGKPDVDSAFQRWTFQDAWSSVAPAFICYGLWAAGYYAKMFLISASKIERKNYATLYRYMAFDRGIYHKLPKSVQKYSTQIFMLGHFGLFLSGILLCPFLFNFFYLHTLYVLVLLFYICHNGAQFYIDYFSKHYESQLAMIEATMRDDLDSDVASPVSTTQPDAELLPPPLMSPQSKSNKDS